MTAGYGKADPGEAQAKANEVVYAELSGKAGALDLAAAYYDFKDLKVLTALMTAFGL